MQRSSSLTWALAMHTLLQSLHAAWQSKQARMQDENFVADSPVTVMVLLFGQSLVASAYAPGFS